MRLRSLRHIVETENGVYQPFPLLFEIALPIATLVILSLALPTGKISLSSVLLYVGVFGVLAAVRLNEYRKFGKLGKPSVALDGNMLLFGQPGNSQSILHVALSEIQELIIYGLAGSRHYRFVRNDSTFFEAVPMWERGVDEAVARFLENRLPRSVKVTVEEPQTFFASVRGDGPERSVNGQ